MTEAPEPTVLTAEQRAFVEQYAPMARAIALGMWRALYRGSGGLNGWGSNALNSGDFISVAYMGLVEASTRADPDHPSFLPDRSAVETFVRMRVRGAIQDQARKEDHVSRGTRERYKAGDVAAIAEVEARPMSLEQVQGSDGGHDGRDRAGMLGNFQQGLEPQQPDEKFSRWVANAVARCISELPVLEQTVLAMHYFIGLDIKPIAEYLDVSESRVGQVHVAAILAVEKRVAELLAEEDEE